MPADWHDTGKQKNNNLKPTNLQLHFITIGDAKENKTEIFTCYFNQQFISDICCHTKVQYYLQTLKSIKIISPDFKTRIHEFKYYNFWVPVVFYNSVQSILTVCMLELSSFLIQ